MSEKRYFKIVASTHKGQTNIIKLFDILEKQTKYSETEVSRKFKDEKTIKSIEVLKSALYKLVLRALRNYYNDLTIESQIKNLIIEADILHKKELYEQYETMLLKAKKIALENECFLYLIEIISKEKDILLLRKFPLTSPVMLSNLIDEEKEVFEKLSNEQKFKNIKHNLLEYYFANHTARNNVEAKTIKSLLTEEIEHINTVHEIYTTINCGIKTKLDIFYARALYFYMICDYEKCYWAQKDILIFLSENPFLEKHNQHLKIISHSNLALMCLHLHKHMECADVIRSIKTIIPESEKSKCTLFTATYFPELQLDLEQGEFERVIGMIDEINKGIEQFSAIFPLLYQFEFYFQFAKAYFGIGEFHKAYFWLNKMLNHPEFKKTKIDFQCFARLLCVIVQFELKNQDLLEYHIRSTYRFLCSRNKLYGIEKVIMELFRKKSFQIAYEEEARMEMFKELKFMLDEIVSDPFEKQTLITFDFISWVESKIRNVSLKVIIKEKNNGAF